MQIITSFSLLFRFKLVLTGPLPSFVSTYYVNLVGKLISPCLTCPVLQTAIIILFSSFNVFGTYRCKATNMSLLFNYWAYCLYSISLTIQWSHDWETWASHVYLGRTQGVVLACPVVSWPTTLANTAGISQPDTSKGESEKEWKLAGEKAFWTWLKQNFPLLTREPEYMGSAAS